jgi:aspartyl-tRNA(Asn)/glutamyl-tRNA(Gln) amidotransferase subunit C
MDVNKKMLEKVASVARIDLTEDEKETFVPQVKEILDYFELLQEVDTLDVEPSFQPILLRNRLREDIPKNPLSKNEVFKNSSNNQDDYFKGPKAV